CVSPGSGSTRSPVVLPSLRREESARAVLLNSLGALYALGQDVAWPAVAGSPRRVISLPSYRWQKERFWAPASAVPRPAPAASRPAPVPPQPIPTTAVSEYYDLGAEFHRRRPGDGSLTFDGYLTWGLFPRPRPGFSWLRTVLHPERHPEDYRCLVEAQEELRRVLFRAIDLSRVETVFDFGCGYGADMIALAQRHPHLRLEGYTISARQAEIGNARAAGCGLGDRVHIYHRDSAKQPFPGRYDLVLGLEVAGLIEDKPALFANVAEHLKDGGQVLLADFIANAQSSIDIPETSTYSSTAAEWCTVLGAHRLRLIDTIDISPEIANCLADPEFDRHLAAATAEASADPRLLRHVASYPNVEQALRQDALRYALFRAVKDSVSTVDEIVDFNRATIARAKRYSPPDQAPESLALERWLHTIEWRPAPPVRMTPATPRRTWLVYAERLDHGRALQRELEALQQTVLLEVAGDPARASNRQIDGQSDSVAGVVYLCDLAETHFDSRALQALQALQDPNRLGCAGLLRLTQAVLNGNAGSRRDPPRLWLVTGGVTGVALDQAPLAGLVRAIGQEHPELRPATIDLRDRSAPALAQLAQELVADTDEDHVVLERGQRTVARFERLRLAGAGRYRPSPEGSYLITGGLGGLGIEVAAWLVGHGAGYLYLAGRSAPSERAAQRLDVLAGSGAEVEVVQADVRRPQEVTELVRKIDGGRYRLRGIVHAAGVLDDRTVLGLTPERTSAVTAPKVLGAWNLHVETVRRDLDFFVLFSGLASIFGSPGQSNYAAANAFLDALAHYRRARGLPALSINWGPWQEAGVVAARGASFTLQGVHSIPTALGLDALALLIASGETQAAVTSFEQAVWQRAYPALARSPLVSGLAPPSSEDARPAGDVIAQLRQAAVGWPRRTLLEHHLRDHIGQVLRLPPEAIDPDAAMKDLGFDSLMALQLRNRLEESLQTQLPVTMVWNYPTIPDLVVFLAGKLGLRLHAGAPDADGTPAGALEPSPALPVEPADDLLDRIKGLSEDEALRLLNSSVEAAGEL
ncbi:MAG: SDR family NAD(P)-dependent oxidoreductase, partial [Chloroflexota bacterium]